MRGQFALPPARRKPSLTANPGFDIPAPPDKPVRFNMEHLHAYWRMEYIEAPRDQDGGNLFTTLPALGDDAKALIIHRSRLSYLLLNRYPYNAGHLLAVPFRAATDLSELDAAERADLMDEIIRGKEILQAALKPAAFNIGFNIGAGAGGSIPHLHAHIVPRWNGDTNFMPVIGQTRVLPQSLEAMYARLAAVAAGFKP
jgi:ATP adenylyltransferase